MKTKRSVLGCAPWAWTQRVKWMWPTRTYIFLFGLLHKESLPIVTQFHVKIHCIAIDFYVNLRGETKYDLALRVCHSSSTKPRFWALRPNLVLRLPGWRPQRDPTSCPTSHPYTTRLKENVSSLTFITNFKNIFNFSNVIKWGKCHRQHTLEPVWRLRHSQASPCEAQISTNLSYHSMLTA